jgi:outer membrane protein assembly factor BamB
MPLDQLVFVGFNSRVAALDRDTGEVVWQWRAPKPRSGGYVTLLLDGDRLIVSVNGYLYCLDPFTGDLFWYNEMKGFGTGVASLVTVRGSSTHELLAQAAAVAQQQAAAAGAAGAGS